LGRHLALQANVRLGLKHTRLVCHGIHFYCEKVYSKRDLLNVISFYGVIYKYV